jgi:hypothetical protein
VPAQRPHLGSEAGGLDSRLEPCPSRPLITRRVGASIVHELDPGSTRRGVTPPSLRRTLSAESAGTEESVTW